MPHRELEHEGEVLAEGAWSDVDGHRDRAGEFVRDDHEVRAVAADVDLGTGALTGMKLPAGQPVLTGATRDGRVVLDGPPSSVFGESSWPVLRSTNLEPTHAALTGARAGLGSTPTVTDFLGALSRRPA